MTAKPQNEQRAEYVKVMGPELGSLCYELREQLDWLKHKWMELEQLFAKGAERIELLNTVAPNFFYMLHKLMLEDAMLHLCRITDPAETRTRLSKKFVTRKNLTVRGLPGAIPEMQFRDRVKTKVQEAHAKCEFARLPRNRLLAHADSEAIQYGSGGPPILRSHIEDAMKSLRDLIALVEEHYGLPPSALIVDPFGAQSLIAYLERAVHRSANKS